MATPNKGGRPRSTETNRLTPKPPVSFTPALKELFLTNYEASGLLYFSAKLTGVSSSVIYDHMKTDPEFKERVGEAKERHTDTLIAEAQRRAVEGDPEPIIGGKDRDQVVTMVTRRSDRLMELMLKSRRGEFSAGADKANNGAAPGQLGGVLLIPFAQLTVDDWEKVHGEAAKGKTGAPNK